QTEVAEVPTAFCPFQGQLLAGVGNILRLYDLGKRKLLRKSENRQFPGAIRKIHAYDNRIYVSDMTSGTFMLEYTAADKSMKIFADSVSKVYTTDSILVDYNTVASSSLFRHFANFSTFVRRR
ncbi:Splicing factor 3B subunit 3, partial [Bonamia ostreae]